MIQTLRKWLHFFSWFVLAIVVGYVVLALEHSFVCHHVQHDERACVVCLLTHTITDIPVIHIAVALFYILLAVVVSQYSFVSFVQRCAANLNKAPPHF